MTCEYNREKCLAIDSSLCGCENENCCDSDTQVCCYYANQDFGKYDIRSMCAIIGGRDDENANESEIAKRNLALKSIDHDCKDYFESIASEFRGDKSNEPKNEMEMYNFSQHKINTLYNKLNDYMVQYDTNKINKSSLHEIKEANKSDGDREVSNVRKSNFGNVNMNSQDNKRTTLLMERIDEINSDTINTVEDSNEVGLLSNLGSNVMKTNVPKKAGIGSKIMGMFRGSGKKSGTIKLIYRQPKMATTSTMTGSLSIAANEINQTDSIDSRLFTTKVGPKNSHSKYLKRNSIMLK